MDEQTLPLRRSLGGCGWTRGASSSGTHAGAETSSFVEILDPVSSAVTVPDFEIWMMVLVAVSFEIETVASFENL